LVILVQGFEWVIADSSFFARLIVEKVRRKRE
jgi:hypothetical protein